MIKGLVGQPLVLKYLIRKLAIRINNMIGDNFDFINGNVTGGMIPGWMLRDELSRIQNREIPYLYLRGSRKKGGHNEFITGHQNNKLIKKGMKGLIIEELVNYGQTTTNSVLTYRDCGYKIDYTTTILHYDHPETNDRLKENNIRLIHLITLPEILDIALDKNILDVSLVNSYKDYLKDSIKWQLDRGYVIPHITAMKAKKEGYNMIKLSSDDAIKYGTPQTKIEQGIVYYTLSDKKVKKVYVALDYYNPDDVLNKAKELCNNKSDKFGFKINLDSLLNFNSKYTPRQFIDMMSKLGKSLFVDIKIWNGLRTMSSIIKGCVDCNVDIVNVYAHSGIKYLKALSDLTKGSNTKLFTVTVLTHYNRQYVNNLYNGSFEDTINKLIKISEQGNVDGVILPSTYLNKVNTNLLKLCPGIRPEWFKDSRANNQIQISTPLQAINDGADYLVIGSPITKSKNSIEALNKLLMEIS
jgi:orotidine-5'-phosphate decarboxylase